MTGSPSLRARGVRLRRAAGVAIAILGLPAIVVATYATPGGQANLAAVRDATVRFHDVAVAEDAGYGEFYECTDREGVGAMGWHWVNGALVGGDPSIDPLQPEVLVYEPRPNGTLRLVGIEYVTIKALWEAEHGVGTVPTVLGMDLKLVEAPNRYGLPDFYQRHVWIWKGNPLGTYNDWNSTVSCRGNGDAAV